MSNENDLASDDLLFRDECYAIQGAIFEVYREMGSGFLEPVYQESLTRELAMRGIPFSAKRKLVIHYKGVPLERSYVPDFVCHGQVIVELKAVRELIPQHEAQVLNYLKATGHRRGLLVNFSSYPKVTIKRLVR